MEQKLQELLDKVYTEGVAKGEEVANTMVRDAERKAERIVEDAEKTREIRRQAQEEAEELRRNVASELRLSASQAMHALQQQISHLIVAKAITEPLRQAFSEEAFLKNIIDTLIHKWNPGQDGQPGLALLLPEKEKDTLGQYFSAKAKAILNGGLQVSFDNRLENGFRIGPAGGGYLISFTDNDFETFFKEYLRPKTKTLLYG